VNASLRRLLSPRSIALIGGASAEAAIRSCRAIGYDGDLWPVHPTRSSTGGLPCFTDLSELPGVPDAALVSVSRERSAAVVSELAGLGAGGVVCHASGFAEDGARGTQLQTDLVAAAGDMALVGPNCLGIVNYLDGAALWPEQHGGERVDRGVAVVVQSGNLGQNLTMQRRSLPLALVVSVGNAAVTGVLDVVEALLDDPRITAIGLHLEDMPDASRLSRLATTALRRRVPIVVLKSGSSRLGAQTTLSHTSSLAGPDVLCDALFRRFGIARVHRVEAFVEHLKLLHVHGSLPGSRIASASCSGGEAAHVADLAEPMGVMLPEFDGPTTTRLQTVLGDRVAVANPLDYSTYIWGDQQAQTDCFSAFLDSGADCHLLVLDFPRGDRCDTTGFETTVRAFMSAQRAVGSLACVVSSLPECMPEEVGKRLLDAGIAPMQGISDCLQAIVSAEEVGRARARVDRVAPLPAPGTMPVGRCVDQLDEAAAKLALQAFGVPVPPGAVGRLEEVGELASRVGFPVAVKAVSSTLAHKSERNGVRLGLTSGAAVELAAAGMSALSDRFLVEQMVDGAVAELVVAVQRDPAFGLTLTVGAGGLLVELINDTVTLLLPATDDDVRAALRSLAVWPLLDGFRGRSADVDRVVEAVSAIVGYATSNADRLLEVEVNPLLVRPESAVAVDAVIRLYGSVDGVETATRDLEGAR
jgi:acyl-CoA synthetase (NDP forming)